MEPVEAVAIEVATDVAIDVLTIVLEESDVRTDALDRARLRLRQGPVADLVLADRILELDDLFREFAH